MSLLGSSPITSILGYVVIGATVVQQVFTTGGLPSTAEAWFQSIIQIVVGISLRMTKDQNVSNAPSPTITAQPVK